MVISMKPFDKEKYRKALESLYIGNFDVIVRTTETDPETKQERIIETSLLTDEPCRLSDVTLQVTGSGEAPDLIQKKKLFCASDRETPEGRETLEIPAGSKIIVTQNGVTTAFKRSSEPTVHECHQEIMLDIFKNWA